MEAGRVASDESPSSVQLSALQHYTYCPRQCALIHVEQVFLENVYTATGRWAHERVDVEAVACEQGVQVLRALPVWSDVHGLVGRCDVVELHAGVPYPVEYKRGRRETHRWDDIQLCAEAICLEEMFGVPVASGAIYHISSKHRREVSFTTELRNMVVQAVQAVRELLEREELPAAVNDARCTLCSLRSVCMPEQTDGKQRRTWVQVLEGMEANESCV
jgi:CRISPR-associated exonuclease Cas4